MSSCSSCCAHYCADRGESVWTGLMSSFPPARTIMKTETCARPHARTSDLIAISASLLCTHVHCRHMSSCWTGRWHLRAACTTHLASAVALEMHGFMHCGANGCNFYLDVVYASLLIVIAPAGRPHLVKFYFSTGRPERRAYILVPDLHGVHSSNNLVHSSNNSTKLLLPGARKPICSTVGSQTRPPCSRCCWPSWPAQ